MRIIIGINLYILFFIVCYLSTGTDQKNLGGFRSYPDEVQKRVYEDPVLGSLAPKKFSIPVTIASNLLMFAVIFSVIGITLKEVLQLSDFLLLQLQQ